MIYAYTRENRLEHPHRYMYTPFEGFAFLDAFLENRQTQLARYPDGFQPAEQSLRDHCAGLMPASRDRQSLSAFNLDEPVVTQNLLDAILQAQLARDEASETKGWLDRLVQRFEVSKKIFETYLPGFRKGEGAADELRLYWQFGVALYLQYEDGSGLKYLSTALKITDLLCSLPFQQLSAAMTDRETAMLLQAEIRLVKELIGKKINGLSA